MEVRKIERSSEGLVVVVIEPEFPQSQPRLFLWSTRLTKGDFTDKINSNFVNLCRKKFKTELMPLLKTEPEYI